MCSVQYRPKASALSTPSLGITPGKTSGEQQGTSTILSTPSLGITEIVVLNARILSCKKVLSTPSLGITVA